MAWNPFGWTADHFIFLYVALAAALLLTGFHFRSTIGSAATVRRELNALELAYLTGGAEHFGDAALLKLVLANGASIGSSGQRITVTDLTPLASLADQPQLPSDMTPQQFQTMIEPAIAETRVRLQGLGYSPTDEQVSSFRMIFLTALGLLLALGAIEATLGSIGGDSLKLLGTLLSVTALIGAQFAKPPSRTLAGQEVVKAYKASHARASRATLQRELLFAVALSGAWTLWDTEYAAVHAASKIMNADDGGSWWWM
jgi:uncharacterized protein (TIGR04222 family)